MRDSNECCGWASWGELAGMGDGHVAVDLWDAEDAGAAVDELTAPKSALRAGATMGAESDEAAAPAVAALHSGKPARVRIAMSRWRLAERNKRG